jgi:purine-binding chemotaxis protein CheW
MTTTVDTPGYTRRYCSFRVGEDCFAIESASVSEVLRSGKIARVPLAQKEIVGLVHLRGRIVPIIDLAGHLGLTSAARQAATHLVIRIQGDCYGLLVDEMLDVIDIPDTAIEHPTAAEAAGDALIGVFAAEQRLVHLLDPGRMIHSLVRQRTQSLGRHGAHNGGSQ